ncbi:MAG TPA: family 16 glycoside hydrolase [Burkholderiales bacterium]|nr:family 16 glycoside hydrolase [Burkholderiales bacterium]
MKPYIYYVAAVLCTTPAIADTVNFDGDATGAPPAGWVCGTTGKGSPHWAVQADPAAPSKPNVLKQSGNATFAWCAKKDVAIKDGFVEVKIKPLQGREDQAGGVVWRWKDGDNYYVARANALENNVSIYHTTRGSRHTIKYVNAPVATNQWHTLRVEFSGKQAKVILDGKPYIEVQDSHIEGAGAVGVWTKADSVTAFDDFTYGGS